MVKHIFICLIFCFLSLVLKAQINMPSLFSDGMILQQKTNVPVWGTALPGEKITVKGSWNGKEVSAIAGNDGKWMVKLKTSEAGGPFKITVEGSEIIEIDNVLLGEVWLASGQSNMEMPVMGFPGESAILNSEQLIAQANYPKIRLFNVENVISYFPEDDVKGKWQPTTPENVPYFSAAAYTFALELHKNLNVPVGIITSDWGGTVAEAWTSEESLRILGDFDVQLDKLKHIRENYEEVLKKDEELTREWEKRSKIVLTEFSETDFDDSDWKPIKTPSLWEEEGYPEFDGIAWYRKKINIPAEWSGKELVLNLGPVNDNDITWFNGYKAGETEGALKNRRYIIPGEYVKTGENLIAVRVTDIGNVGGIYGDANGLKIFPSGNLVADTLFLAGEWKFKPVADKPVIIKTESPNTPSVLYNGMIAPIVPYGIRGAIWYQGESNVGRARQYNQLFPLMINDWRKSWGAGDFPFYFVQIAPFPYGGDGLKSAALRDSQRRSLQVKNTGMIVTMDIGDTTDIHPIDKASVGERLSRWALSKDYGKKGIVFSGPLYKKVKVKKDKAIISFYHTNGGLTTAGDKLKGFEIAGDDGHFVTAHSVIKGNKVIVWSEEVKQPVTVRYAWTDTAQPFLFNKAGLPASTFTTSDN